MKYRKWIFTCLVGALMTAFSITVNAQKLLGQGNNALVGSWKVSATTSAPPMQFGGLITFMNGGGLIETNAFPFQLLGQTASPGHGSWSYEGRQMYNYTFLKLLFDPSGNHIGILKVSGSFTYSLADGTISGPGTVAQCDTAGENCVVLDSNATVEGERIPSQ